MRRWLHRPESATKFLLRSDSMEETQPWPALKYNVLGALHSGIRIFVFVHPFFALYLWKFWWLRPIIQIWYSPFTVVVLMSYVFFWPIALFRLKTNGGKNSALRPLFMSFQLFILKNFLRALHGLEIHGLDNLPEGGGLIAYYHAPFIPVDIIYLFSYVYLRFGRMIGGAVDVNLHKDWFLGPLVEIYDFSSDRQTFIEGLKNGHLRSVAPGGAYEAMFSQNYSIEWRSRIGFAKIAKQTGVPVIPMFTTNLWHGMSLMSFNHSETMKTWYAKLKRPLYLPKYYLPVKMHIHLGKPLVPRENEEPEEFAQRVPFGSTSLPPHPSTSGRRVFIRCQRYWVPVHRVSPRGLFATRTFRREGVLAKHSRKGVP